MAVVLSLLLSASVALSMPNAPAHAHLSSPLTTDASSDLWAKWSFDNSEIETQIAAMNVFLKRLQENSTRWEKDPYKSEIWGSITDFKHQMNTYRQWSSLKRIKTFCETGMSAGKSSLNLLSSNPEARMISFDLGDRYYSQPVNEYLSAAFPGRFEAHFGSSSKTMWDFTQAFPSTLCDLVLVDGDHEGDGALNDLYAFQPLADCNTVILMDDVNNGRFPGPEKAYKVSASNGLVTWQPCEPKDGAGHEGEATFCIGQFTKDKWGKSCDTWVNAKAKVMA